VSTKLPRDTVESLVAEAEIEMIDAIIHNEQLRYEQLKETRTWLLNLLPTPGTSPSETSSPSPADA
jgi:hypothetical protein